MNLEETHRTFTKDFAHKVSDFIDSTAYAFVTKQYEYMIENGIDPREYEVVFASDEYPQYTNNGMKIDKRLLVRRIEEKK